MNDSSGLGEELHINEKPGDLALLLAAKWMMQHIQFKSSVLWTV